jgi:hypothetical protein
MGDGCLALGENRTEAERRQRRTRRLGINSSYEPYWHVYGASLIFEKYREVPMVTGGGILKILASYGSSVINTNDE